jgi:hypothetical protein
LVAKPDDDDGMKCSVSGRGPYSVLK